MKTEVILNGTIKLVLIPENDLEKLALEQLSKNTLQPTVINGHTQILDKIVHEGIILSPSK
jgi:hypothetical protein